MATAKGKPKTKASPDHPKRAQGKRKDSAVKRTADLSEQVLRHVEKGQRGAVDAVRDFVGAVREKPAPDRDGSSKRRGVIDSTLEMTDRLVHLEYEFVRNVVHSAGESLASRPRQK